MHHDFEDDEIPPAPADSEDLADPEDELVLEDVLLEEAGIDSLGSVY